MLSMLRLAGKISLPTSNIDSRDFWIGCVGYRKDGTLVSAKNGSAIINGTMNIVDPRYHAEGRTLRKLGKDAPIIYVSRIRKLDNKLAMAAPCEMCQALIRSHRVKKVFFSINEQEYGLWIPATDKWKIYKK